MSQTLSREFVVAGMAFAILAMSPAQAHNAGVSTSRVAIQGRAIDVEINALGRDYEAGRRSHRRQGIGGGQSSRAGGDGAVDPQLTGCAR
jgi:hypothetical protein